MQKQYLGDTADTEKVGGTYADNEEVENKVSEDAVSVTDPAKVVNGSCQTEIHIITLIHIITIYPTQFCLILKIQSIIQLKLTDNSLGFN